MKFKVGILACVAGMLICNSTLAKSISVQEIQDLPSANYSSNSSSAYFDQNHWVYKTLKDISLKHGSIVNLSDKTFDGTRPLSRNEAAVLLVNLVGKIHQDNIKLNDAEQAKLEIVTEELQKDIDALTGRVATLETDVKTIKGTVSKIENNQQKSLKVNFGDDMYLNGGIIGSYTGVIQKGVTNTPSNFNIGLIDMTLGGKLRPGIEYKTQFFPQTALDGNSSDATRTMMGDVYLGTEYKKNKIIVGRTRIPIGIEGTKSPYSLAFASRAQIARNLSNARDTGIKVIKEDKFYNYYLGAYNGTRNGQQDNNRRLDIATWVGIKPLANNLKLGSLILDAGYADGKNTSHYDVWGAHAGYKFKKLGIDTEYSYTNGYAGLTANKKAEGLYLATTYDLTPKVQLAARYDTFDPNKDLSEDKIDEYTLGCNYFMNKNNIKFQLNYVYVDNYAKADSHRVVLQSQYNTW